MAGYHARIKLRWLDESAFLESDRRKTLELFLDSIGITSDVAADIFELMLLAKARELSLKTSEIKKGIIKLRGERKVKNTEKGLTNRNIQVWLSYFEDIGLFDSKVSGHRFRMDKRPSEAFKRVGQLASESLNVSERLLKNVEEGFDIR